MVDNKNAVKKHFTIIPYEIKGRIQSYFSFFDSFSVLLCLNCRRHLILHIQIYFRMCDVIIVCVRRKKNIDTIAIYIQIFRHTRCYFRYECYLRTLCSVIIYNVQVYTHFYIAHNTSEYNHIYEQLYFICMFQTFIVQCCI